MSKAPLLSVVIPAYQSAETLPRAIASVLSQTFIDFELIIVDNGSTDATYDLIVEAQKHETLIKCVRLEENQRPAGGRNAGVESAKGDFIAFLDADDEWLPEKLGIQVQLLKNNPHYAAVISDSLNINNITGERRTQSENNAAIMQKLSFEPVPKIPKAYFVNGDLSRTMYTKSFVNMSTSLLRRRSFQESGGFDEKRFGTEDIDFWIRFSRKNKFIYYHHPTVYCHQGTGASAMSESWMLELIDYHRTNLTSPDYTDLHDLALKNLFKIYRYLIVFYAKNAKPRKAVRIFFESLSFRFDSRLAVYAFLSFLGPIPYKVAGKILSQRKKEKVHFSLGE